jgi:hypothetical protein
MMLGIEYQLLIINRIKEINKIKDYDKRLAEIIDYKEKIISAFKDDMDDLFAIADLTETKTEQKEVVIKTIIQLSIAFDEEQQEKMDYDFLCDSVAEAVEGLYWYDKQILELYIKLGNYRAVEKETGIPFPSVYKTVQKATKQIRQKVIG